MHREKMKTTPVGTTVLVLVSGALLVSACEGDDAPLRQAGEPAFASLITEADSLRCGTFGVLHKNRSRRSLTFHLKVSDPCIDTLPELGVSRVTVEDSTGRVITVDTITSATYRGTLDLPPGTRLKLECHSAAPITAHCTWEYKYNLP